MKCCEIQSEYNDAVNLWSQNYSLLGSDVMQFGGQI